MTTRRQQIELQFLPKLVRELKAAGCTVNADGRKAIKEALRSAALVGGIEERTRSLEIVRHKSSSDDALFR